jgi:hypothetical protein
MKKTRDVIEAARKHLARLNGHIFDVLDISKPISPIAAVNLAKVISKLSPLVGNLIEFNTCEFLNEQREFAKLGKWCRQDPGFPDTIFQSAISPTPGFEIKAWFPLATEITARFKDSQNHFIDDRTYVAMLAWLPESLIFGRPRVIDIVIVSGASVAKARDEHYHNPPDYLVLEPGDTAGRARNLQQTTTSGYKWQALVNVRKEAALRAEAERMVAGWGPNAKMYSPSPKYQARLRTLYGTFNYRLDTNFAKMDRIVHADIEAFKARVYKTKVHGITIGEWNRLLASADEMKIRDVLADRFGIRHESEAKLIK